MKYAILAAASLSLSACVVDSHPHHGRYDAYPDPVHVKVRTPLIIDYDHGHYHGGHGFCPPGQAKKGNC